MIVGAVRTVLEALDEQGGIDYDNWDDQLLTQMQTLEAGYRILRNAQRDLADYSDLAAQTAYLYRYVIGHAEFIHEILQRARAESGQRLFHGEELLVTSFGGGPGSELLGLIKYLSQNNDEGVVRIVYTVLDKEGNWQHVVEALVQSIETGIDIVPIFVRCDVSGTHLPAAATLDREALIFMSFFISEVCAVPNSDRVRVNVQNALASMRAGALLVYNDSSAYSFHSFFDSRVAAARRFQQLSEVREDLHAPQVHLGGIFDEYQERFGYGLKMNGNAVAKVLRRA